MSWFITSRKLGVHVIWAWGIVGKIKLKKTGEQLVLFATLHIEQLSVDMNAGVRCVPWVHLLGSRSMWPLSKSPPGAPG